MVGVSGVEAPASARFTRRQWLLLIGCGMGFAVTGADPAVFSANIALVRTDLGLDGAETAFIASLATLVLAATILGAGVLGDIRGKKQMFIVGGIITAIGEVLVWVPGGFPLLIAARAVAGIGFAFLLGLSLTIVNASFTPEQRPRAIGMYLAMAFACTAPMPAIAGLVSAGTDWRNGFLVFAGFALLAAGLAWRFIDPIPKAEGRRLDLAGILLAAVTLVGLVYGISRLQDGLNVGSLVPLGIGIVGAVLFVVVERRVAQPALDLRLFSRGPFNAAVGGVATYNFLNGGFTLLVSYYLVVVQGASTAVLGLLMVPAAIVQAFAAGWAGRLITALGSRTALAIGLGACTLTCFAFAALGVDTPIWVVVIAFTMMSVSNALTQTPVANLMMSYAPRELGGSIAGVKSGVGQTAYSLGPVVYTVVATILLRMTTSAEMDRAGLTDDDVREALASTSGGATSAGGGANQVLDPDTLAALTEAIRVPFAHGLQWTSLVMAIVPLTALLLALRLLPRKGQGADASGSAPSGDAPHS
ncbi:MFS transporter [Agromyces mangrovi Wang et al. 2018]|uniref:MFS transporter n=1 Tax=Agromyces mangrovi TaxID=1858653 RepID=UPI002573E06F|nr:MFS transporter [Agromyces mangrovi]BDZ63562.1 MFS transporter [Agromyces mangrovi]